ncbi:hypothetical protein OCA26_29550 [Bacillus cereus]|nr:MULTISPECIES: hypothetical protein [unclassified Bacillus (in: firmicutes)]MCU0097633.1 hypothetical protein [Bacillus sp. OR9]MCU4760196.1 hypothetical protein [Bacillus cereus]MCU0097811.1 hypothetical protein [Bacillus sp. OR9]MCU5109975.1 hypothetical protein [Bacillus cereus]MCU5343341.1 hypothetical protein [Bacillus cereus]
MVREIQDAKRTISKIIFYS